MTRSTLVLALLWGVLGLGLVAHGVYETLSWSTDPTLKGSSLRWWHSTFILPGLAAVGFALLLPRGGMASRALGYALAAIYALYVIYIVLLTPPAFVVRPMLALQAVVLGLAICTVLNLLKEARKGADHMTERS